MAERPNFVPLEQLQRKASGYQRVVDKKDAVLENLRTNNVPSDLNPLATPNPIESIQRIVRLGQITQRYTETTIPNAQRKLVELQTEIIEVSKVQQDINQVRQFLAQGFLSAEQAALAEEKFREIMGITPPVETEQEISEEEQIRRQKLLEIIRSSDLSDLEKKVLETAVPYTLEDLISNAEWGRKVFGENITIDSAKRRLSASLAVITKKLPQIRVMNTLPVGSHLGGLYYLKLEELPLKTVPKKQFVFNLTEIPERKENFQQVKDDHELTAYLGILGDERQRLFGNFLSQTGANRILGAMYDFQSDDGSSNKEFIQYMVGGIFEQIGYNYIKTKYPSAIVLSPYDIYLIYRNKYPNNATENKFGAPMGINNISFPDGLVIRETDDALVIDGVLEYKCSREIEQRTNNQTPHLTPWQVCRDLGITEGSSNYDPEFINALVHALRPDLPDKPLRLNPDAELIYVTPNNSTINIPNTGAEKLPLTTINVGNFVHLLIRLVKKNKLAGETQGSFQSDLDKLLELRPQVGRLTPENLKEVDDEIKRLRAKLILGQIDPLYGRKIEDLELTVAEKRILEALVLLSSGDKYPTTIDLAQETYMKKLESGSTTLERATNTLSVILSRLRIKLRKAGLVIDGVSEPGKIYRYRLIATE